MKRILIFGGNTGVVATQVANKLAGAGGAHPVLADVKKPVSLNVAVEHSPLVMTDQQAMLKAVSDTDVIISCVENNPDLIQRSAMALFTAVRRHENKRVILLSSMAVYGSVEGMVNESSAVSTEDAYAAARVNAEMLAATCHNTICLRGGVEYGCGSLRWSGMIAKLLLSKRLGDLGAAGDGCCNLLFMDDLVNAIINAVQLPDTSHQAFNLCSSERVTWNEYLIRYAIALGAVPVKRIGRRRLNIETKLAIPLKLAEVALGQRNASRLHVPAPLSSSMIRTFNQRIALDVAKAEQMLGMQWTPLQTGLKAAAEWVLNSLH